MNKISKVFSVIFSVCMMSGCVYRGFLPENYKFDSQSKKGLVVFSISCDIVQADINFNLTNGIAEKDLRHSHSSFLVKVQKVSDLMK